MTRAAKGRRAWALALGLAAGLLAAALPAPASASVPGPSYAETRVRGSNLEIPAGVGAERSLSPTRIGTYATRYDELAAGYPLVPRGRLASVLQQKLRNDLVRSATAAGDDGVSAVTRAIQKHSARDVTAFSPVRGNLAGRNAAGRALVDDILGNPGATFTQRTTGRFGEVLDVVAPDGRGLRFGSDGQFIGLLEPPL